MTPLDRDGPLPGYRAGSPWPVECGGNRRQKLARTPGPGVGDGERLVARTTANDRWNVMVVWRDPGELYLYSTGMVGTPDPVGRVERLDPVTLEVAATSGDLPTGGHAWCGAVVAHADGDLYVANGRFVHRLDPGLAVVAERRLSTDGPHNGLLVFDDGTIVTKDIRLGGDPTTITLLAPDGLEVVAQEVLPEPSMGRIAADGDDLYVPGTEHLFRFRYADGRLELDDGWRPAYRRPRSGLAWDSCLARGAAWLLDNGDTEGVHVIIEAYPAGSVLPSVDRWARSPSPQAVLRVDVGTGEVRTAEPFGAPDGAVIAPPLVADGLVVCWDTANARLAALDEATLEPVWALDACVSMQPLAFPDSGELVVDDQRTGGDYVVLDLRTGVERARASTGWPPMPNGMFLTPGLERDVYACQPFGVVRLGVATAG